MTDLKPADDFGIRYLTSLFLVFMAGLCVGSVVVVFVLTHWSCQP